MRASGVMFTAKKPTVRKGLPIWREAANYITPPSLRNKNTGRALGTLADVPLAKDPR